MAFQYRYGTYPMRQLLMLITFLNCCVGNQRRMQTIHSRKGILSYAMVEIVAIMKAVVKKCRIQS